VAAIAPAIDLPGSMDEISMQDVVVAAHQPERHPANKITDKIPSSNI
jgi:hypothetical protein